MIDMYFNITISEGKRNLHESIWQFDDLNAKEMCD